MIVALITVCTSKYVLFFEPNFFLISRVEESSQPTKYANKNFGIFDY